MPAGGSRPGWSRRHLGAAGIALIATAGRAAEPPADVRAVQDFDELWRTLDERYCFFGAKRTDWQLVRRRYRPLVAAAEDEAMVRDLLRQVAGELYDSHTSLADRPEGSPRLPPFDLLGEWHDGVARLLAVDEGSAAADAGLVVSDRVLAVDGQPVAAAARRFLPRCLARPDPAANAYALNTALAGYRGRARTLLVEAAGDSPRTVTLPPRSRPTLPDLAARRLENGFGWIAIRSFAEDATVAAFDRALAELRDAPGLLIDVRDNGGGDTAVARPIMGRFITALRPYALMRRREGTALGAAWTEWVDPRGPFTWTKPVVVLANRWSGSMAEGFPMGMRAICGAPVVGTPMMGLGAAVYQLRLDRTGVDLQYSAEPVYDIAGRPRSAFRPDVAVADGADILAAGTAVLAGAVARAG